MKRSIFSAGLAASVSIPFFVLSAPAFADTTQQIIDGLSNSNVYTGFQASNVPDGVQAEYNGSNIAVVFVNDSGINTSQVAEQVLGGLEQSGSTIDTVIVSVNGSSFGVSSQTGDSVAIATFLNENGANSLVSNSTDIKSMSTGMITSTETNPQTGVDSAGVGLIGGAGIVLGAALLITVSVLFIKKILTRETNIKEPKKILAEDYFMNISKDLGAEVSNLRELIVKHREKGLSDGAEKLIRVDKRLGELFVRLSRKGTTEQISIAAVKYQDLLKKIIFIMNEDHYMDIVLNPELWNRSDERKQNSLEAVEAVDEQILDNIRQLNDSQDLEFNITLRALMTNGNNMNEIEELLFKNDDMDNDYRSFGR